jgi:CDP-diacylglycerol---serine O-phosphatidyltransferase
MVANLLTMGNAVCGFVAIVVIGCGGKPDQALNYEFKQAAWLIIIGMAFDVLDGRVARTTKTTSELGAQLDSLADLVTFGVAPAVLVFRMHLILPEWHVWRWLLWCLSVAYFLGAVLRLARFTVETAPDETAHLCFKGLPSPGAAGTIASLVIFYFYLKEFTQRELKMIGDWMPHLHQTATAIADAVPAFLPFVAGLLGYLMVSNRLRYIHVAGSIVSRRTFDAFVYTIFGLIILAIIPEVTLPLLFLVYLLSAPVKLLIEAIARRKVSPGAGPS